MRKTQLVKKRILALALSVSMVFASTDTYVVLAAEADKVKVGQNNDYQAVNSDTAPAILEEEPDEVGEVDSASDLDDAEKDDSSNDSNGLEGSDSSDDPEISEEPDSENDSEAVEADDSAGDKNETGENGGEVESTDDEEKSEEEGSDPESEEASEGDMNETAQEEAALFVLDNTEDIIDSGKINDITWSIDKDGLLTITGTGDYISNGLATPPWADRSDVRSAVVNISGITTTEHMFSNCENLRNVDLSNLDTSNVTNMSYMFSGCRFISNLDLNNFNTSNVTDMSHMFSGCEYLKVSLDLNHFDTSNVTDMSYMFSGCGYTTVLDVINFDTRNVTDMSHMFSSCYHWTSLDLSNFDTSNVTTMDSMFQFSSYLERLDVSSFDTSNVTDMGNMFYGCHSLSSLDVSKFDTGNVTDMRGMFGDCSGLSSLDVSNFATGNVTDMRGMFGDCSGLSSLDVSNFATGNVTDMRDMFSGCSGLNSLDVSSFDTGNVTDMRGMFGGCSGLSSLDVSNFTTGNVTDMGDMFSGCSGLSSLDVGNFATGNVTDMQGMFSGCSGLSSLDVSSFDTSNLSSEFAMMNMFSGCSNLSSLDLSNFDTSKVMSMQGMFSGCSGLTSLNVSSFDTRYVTSMESMFSGCSSLTSLDLSSFEGYAGNMGSPYYPMDNMFSGCSSLISLDFSNFDFSHDGNYGTDNMFGDCSSLSCIVTPKNCLSGISLPTGTWYQDAETTYTTLPTGLNYSIVLYKDSYPGDGITKQVVFISGISMSSKEYDGTPNPYTGTVVVKDSAGNTITDVATTYSYTGKLADGSIYSETTEAPYQIGSYTLSIVISDHDKYTGQKLYNFSIKKRTVTITAPSVLIELNEQLPVLSELKCMVDGLLNDDKLIAEPILKFNKENISTSTKGSYDIVPYGAEAGNNYSIKYVNGTLNVGDPDDDSVFEDDERYELGIDVKGEIAKIKDKTYDGSPYEPAVKVTVVENNKKKTLTEGTDYRVVYDNNVNAGTGTVTVKGNGIYKGELTATFTIKQKSIKKLKVVTGSLAVGDRLNEVAIPVYVYDGTKLLTEGEGKDYTISGTSNLTAQENKAAKITITAEKDSNYVGSIAAKIAVYNVADASKLINPSDVTISYDAVNGTATNTEGSQGLKITYTGKAIKPVVTVTKEGTSTPLTNKDYKVQYQNNTNAGTAYVIVTGKGKYKGKVVKSFEITPNAARLEITNKTIKDKTYNGKLQKPSVTVKAGGKTLKKNKDYTITYEKNLHAGTATIIVNGKGNYEGALKAERTFVIKPQKITKVSVKGTQKDGLTVTYAKRQLKLEVDYTLEYGEVKKNKVKVTIKAVETEGEDHDFTGSVTKSIKIQ